MILLKNTEYEHFAIVIIEFGNEHTSTEQPLKLTFWLRVSLNEHIHQFWAFDSKSILLPVYMKKRNWKNTSTKWKNI